MNDERRDLHAEIERSFGIRLSDPELLAVAFTTMDAARQARGGQKTPSQPLLEWLGDAVLAWAVRRYLFDHYGEMGRGTLTQIFSIVVSRGVLGQVASRLNLTPHLRMSRGQQKELDLTRRVPVGQLGRAFEALLAVIAVDQGLNVAESVVRKTLGPVCDHIVREGAFEDPLVYLARLVRERLGTNVECKVLRRESSRFGGRIFVNIEVGCYAGTRLLSRATAHTVHKAKIAAAKHALIHEFRVVPPTIFPPRQ